MKISNQTIFTVGDHTLKIGDTISLDGLYFSSRDSKEDRLREIADLLKLVDVLREHVEGLDND